MRTCDRPNPADEANGLGETDEHVHPSQSTGAGGRKPAGERYYRRELDVVRLLAFFLVFLSHSLPRTPTPGVSAALRGLAPLFYTSANASRYGVSLFFTLSAFLICELLLRERQATGTVAIKEFFVRRILRILPLYYLGLLLGVLFALTPGGNRHELIRMGWFAIFMGAWQSAIYGWLDNPMFVLWSVSVEEQFYLFAPWMMRSFNRKSLFGFCAVLVVASSAWVYQLSVKHASDDRMWADSLVQFQCFAAGILLCLILRGRLPGIGIWKRSLLLAGCGVCWLVAASDFGIFTASSIGAGWSNIAGFALVSAGAVMVLLAFLGIDAEMLPGWAVYLGRISYGLYVFHALAHELALAIIPNAGSHHRAIFLLRICIAFGLTVGMAALSYRYFEMPFLKKKRRYTVIQSQPVEPHSRQIKIRPESVSCV